MKILNINSSSNRATSVSTRLGKELIAQLQSKSPSAEVIERHTTYSDLPFVTDSMLGAFFSKEDLTDAQKQIVSVSEQLVSELTQADVIVLTAPIYNFSIPASLKAYFDLVARAGLTFKYTENGPEGLLKDKKAFIIVSSGGTEIGSDIDFAGKYIKHFLSFLGITDTEIIKLDQLMFKADEKQKEASKRISEISTNTVSI